MYNNKFQPLSFCYFIMTETVHFKANETKIRAPDDAIIPNMCRDGRPRLVKETKLSPKKRKSIAKKCYTIGSVMLQKSVQEQT